MCVACFLVGCDQDTMLLQDMNPIAKQHSDSGLSDKDQLLFYTGTTDPSLAQIEQVRLIEEELLISRSSSEGECDCSVTINSISYQNSADYDGYVRVFNPGLGCGDKPRFFINAHGRANCTLPQNGIENQEIEDGIFPQTSQPFNCFQEKNTSFQLGVKNKKYNATTCSDGINSAGDVVVSITIDCIDQTTSEGGSTCNPPGGVTLYQTSKTITLNSSNGYDIRELIDLKGCGCEPIFKSSGLSL